MSVKLQDFDCFGLYLGPATASTSTCGTCKASNRCKAILASHGFDIIGDTINQLVAELPPGRYKDTDFIGQIVDQMLEPPKEYTREEYEAMKAMGLTPADDINVNTI